MPVSVQPIHSQTPSTSLIVVDRALEDLVPYDNNPRDNVQHVEAMVDLITHFGFRVPILTQGSQIVDGHLRYLAAMEMGLNVVPTVDVGDMSEGEVRALRIALNKSVEWADWDDTKLRNELEFIMEQGIDTSLTGFDQTELGKLMDDLVQETKTKDANAGQVDEAHVSITFHMPAGQRQKLVEHLEVHRLQHDLKTRSQALMAALNLT